MCTRVADLLERERDKEKASAKGGGKNKDKDKDKEDGGARMDRAVFLINCAVYLQVCYLLMHPLVDLFVTDAV